MTTRGRSSAPERRRNSSLAAAVVLCVLALVPPLGSAARRYEYAAALQFSLLALVVPALVVAGAPGRWWARRAGARLADRRSADRGIGWALAFVAADLAVMMAWRTPAAVTAVVDHEVLVLLEAVSLLVFGVGLWLELVTSPPLAPRSGPLRRAVLAAVAMWAYWVGAYVIGLSNDDWYPNFHHVAGQGLSAAADQQVAAVVLWFVSAAVFVPVIFWNALQWLRSEEVSGAAVTGFARPGRAGPAAPSRPDGPSPSPSS